MSKTVVIDYLAESVRNYGSADALVAIDVMRATTTAVTCVALGRSCFPVPSVEAALALAARLTNPLLIGEVGGFMPPGFHLNNSPVDLTQRSDVERPVILVSSSGTGLMCAGGEGQPMFVACLRNYSAQVAYLASHHERVAVIGAGTKGEFREEDALCCAWIADGLLKAGFEVENASTAALIERWRGAPVEAICASASAEYLRRTHQVRDLDFILAHIDDLDEVFSVEGSQVVRPSAELLPR